MKDQKMAECVIRLAHPGNRFYLVAVVSMLIILCLLWGCTTGKAGPGRTAAKTDMSADRSDVSQDRAGDISVYQTVEDEKSLKDAFPKHQEPDTAQPPSRTKQPIELKPLLALMQGNEQAHKKDKGPQPKIHLELAFDNADLYEVLDVTLYELFRINYMVDPSIKAKVTFHIQGDYTQHEFINIINNVLQLNNLAVVKGPGNIYKVVRRTASAGLGNAPLAWEEGSAQAGDQTRMIRLRYLAAANAAKNIKPFLSKNAVLVQDSVTNAVVITDTLDNLEKAASILAMMDVEYFENISWRVFPVQETDASEMARDLSRILKTGGLYNRPGMDTGSFEIVPIKTMNALLVVTRWPSILKLVEDWVSAMDHADDSGTNVFVYFVENGTAVELANILSQVYGGTAGSGSGSRKTTIVKPTAGTGLSGELSGEVEIIPDETNNAIVFRANGRDYKIIKEVLKKLDIIPRQVLINVVIAEVSLTGGLEYGVEWFLKDSAQSDYKLQGILDNGTQRAIDTALGSGTTGLSVALFDSEDALRGLITALETEGEVNILSSPNILAIDNKESTIEVVENVPVPTGDSTTPEGTVVRSIQYRDTGVLLKVTPHINSSGLVKIDMSQEVSELGTQDELLQAYSFLTRKAETSLVIENGQTIVIGGLMRSKLDSGGSGIPFLRDIPLLGYAFGGTHKDVTKVELIFLVTPHVINTRAEADEITKDFAERVERIKKLIDDKGL